MRRLITDTNVTLLAITVLVSTLHLLFEFLTFQNEVDFWNGYKDLVCVDGYELHERNNDDTRKK